VNAQVVSCVVGTVAASTSVDVTLIVSSDPETQPASVLNTTVEVSSQETPNGPADWTTVTVSLRDMIGLGLTITGPASVQYGDAQIVYTVTLVNSGNQYTAVDASNVVVTVELDQSLSFASATDAGCSSSGSDVTCAIASLTNGGTWTTDITVTVVAGTRGSVLTRADADADEFDPTDNEAEVTTDIIDGVDLAVSVTASPTSVADGGQVTFTATVYNWNNQSVSPAQDVWLAAYLPTGASSAGAAVADNTTNCTLVTDTFGAAWLCALNDIDLGESKSVSFTVALSYASTGSEATQISLVFSTSRLLAGTADDVAVAVVGVQAPAQALSPATSLTASLTLVAAALLAALVF
jgi:uncharacterized repeat protein (TIGR01451 family)